jgi:hypothetical protein
MRWLRRPRALRVPRAAEPAPHAPDWPDVHDPLVTLFRLEAEDHGYTATLVADDQLEVTRPGREGAFTVWLTNLRQLAAHEPEDQWPAIVADFVGTLVSTAEMNESDALDVADFTLVRPLLRSRLYADDFQTGTEVVTRPAGPGLIEVLAIDKISSLMIPPAATVREWPVTEDELFRIAHDNVRGDGPLEVVEDVIDGVPVAQLYGETAYVTAHALWTEDYPVTGLYGALVVIPAQGQVYVARLDGDPLPDIMNAMVKAGWIGFSEGPRSITPHVYWWHDGALDLAATVQSSNDGDGWTLSVGITRPFKAFLDSL